MRDKPNVLLIICDDLAYGDLASNGNPWRRPGHVDRLRAEGASLNRYYSGPMCSPARASLLTGRYYYRTGVIDTSAGRAMMYPDEVTAAEVARESGYRTGLFGKWHLGDVYPMRAINQGFEEAITFNAGYIGQLPYPPETGYTDPVLEHNGEWKRFSGYCTDIFTNEAIRFIEAARGEPFFVQVAYNAPHTPLEIDEAWVRPYREKGLPENFARVYGMVDNIDANVGRLLDALRRLGIEEETIVIFTSDHGPCPSAADDGKDRFNAGLRGRKGTMYDGGLKVPFFMRWPGRIQAGHQVSAIANPIDALPTLAEACGWSLPPDRPIDGVSLWPLLSGAACETAWPDRYLFLQQDRMKDRPRRYQNYAVIGPRYKLCRPAIEAADELYDLVDDPYEQRDLAGERPDVVRAMRAAYDAWYDDVRSTRDFVPPRIVLGSPSAGTMMLTRQDWLGPGRVHMKDHEIGYWEATFAEGGEYDVTAHVPPLPGGGVLHITLGGERRSIPLPEMADATVVEGIAARPGDARVEAWVEDGQGGRFGVRYLEVSPRSSRSVSGASA